MNMIRNALKTIQKKLKTQVTNVFHRMKFTIAWSQESSIDPKCGLSFWGAKIPRNSFKGEEDVDSSRLGWTVDKVEPITSEIQRTQRRNMSGRNPQTL